MRTHAPRAERPLSRRVMALATKSSLDPAGFHHAARQSLPACGLECNSCACIIIAAGTVDNDGPCGQPLPAICRGHLSVSNILRHAKTMYARLHAKALKAPKTLKTMHTACMRVRARTTERPLNRRCAAVALLREPQRWVMALATKLVKKNW